jgi:hypothetical protein
VSVAGLAAIEETKLRLLKLSNASGVESSPRIRPAARAVAGNLKSAFIEPQPNHPKHLGTLSKGTDIFRSIELPSRVCVDRFPLCTVVRRPGGAGTLCFRRDRRHGSSCIFRLRPRRIATGRARLTEGVRRAIGCKNGAERTKSGRQRARQRVAAPHRWFQGDHWPERYDCPGRRRDGPAAPNPTIHESYCQGLRRLKSLSPMPVSRK